MTPDDKRKRLKEKELGIEADRILASPIWAASYEKLAKDINSRMLSPSTTDEQTIEAKRDLLSLHKVKKYLETVLATGQLADKQLEDERDGRTTSKH
jgi:hypothetical protein